MSNIDEFESRITAALDRIRHGVANIGIDAGGGDDTALRTALERERAENAKLVERVRLLKERQDGQVASLEARVASQGAQMSQLDAELQRLRKSNAEMRDVNAQLRDAASAGVASPDLINTAIAREVDALNAQRSADAAEVDAILEELKPLIEEA